MIVSLRERTPVECKVRDAFISRDVNLDGYVLGLPPADEIRRHAQHIAVVRTDQATITRDDEEDDSFSGVLNGGRSEKGVLQFSDMRGKYGDHLTELLRVRRGGEYPLPQLLEL